MKNKTTPAKQDTATTKWYFLNAEGKILGRFATEATKLLIGKNNPEFAPNANMGSKVVITNAQKIVVTRKKLKDKKYIWYTGFPGGLRSRSLAEKMAKNPSKVIEAAISGMLPKNRLRRERLANLYVYNNDQHPHTAQEKVLKK